MKPLALYFEDGRPVRLGERIGKGGEGEVFALAGASDTAVKVYTGEGASDRKVKIATMVAHGLAARSSLIAFPSAVVNAPGGRFAGFTMKRVNGHKPLFELYAPGARKASFPRADYRFLVRTAANVARAIASVHETGCVIGDINHSGILVSDAAIVALIDADSFQVTNGTVRYLCRVGVPEYTPPELQGQTLAGVVRTPDHDRFGLAVVVFQLLFMGRHPFSGAYSQGEMPIERAIGECRFAYSTERKVGMSPPPAVPLLGDFPLRIRRMFEAAFGPGGRSIRPTAAEWVEALGELEKALKQCGANRLHWHPSAASECPWCRMEARLGIALFVPYSAPGAIPSTPPDPGAAGFNIAAAWAAIEAVRPPPSALPPPVLTDRPVPEPSPEARATKRTRTTSRVLGVFATAVAIGVLIGLPALWPLYVPLGWFGVVKLIAKEKGLSRIDREAADVGLKWKIALAECERRCGPADFAAERERLSTDRAAYLGLPKELAESLGHLKQQRRAQHQRAYLETFYLRRCKIAGVGPSKIATLASYGIETAADVKSSSIQNVPGFGPKMAAKLVDWRRSIEVRYVFNDKITAADQQRINALHQELNAKAADLRRRLLAGPARLATAKRDIEFRRTAPDPQLNAINARRIQVEADRKFL